MFYNLLSSICIIKEKVKSCFDLFYILFFKYEQLNKAKCVACFKTVVEEALILPKIALAKAESVLFEYRNILLTVLRGI